MGIRMQRNENSTPDTDKNFDLRARHHRNMLTEMNTRDQHLFHMNMVKLHAMLPGMLLAVEERRTIEEVLEAYFGEAAAPRAHTWKHLKNDRLALIARLHVIPEE